MITSGAGRDLDQVRKIGYPVFTGGTIYLKGILTLSVSLSIIRKIGG